MRPKTKNQKPAKSPSPSNRGEVAPAPEIGRADAGPWRRLFWICFVVVLVLAVFLRLYKLGDSSFRADTIMFYSLCHSQFSAGAIFNHWMDYTGRTSQFPLPVAVTKGIIDLFHLPPTDLNIHLPSAFFGIATVVIAFFVGRVLYGRWFGLMLALLVTLDPFHIQLSRETYFYGSLLTGIVMVLWCIFWAYKNIDRESPFPAYYYINCAVGLFLLTYSHLSGWWFAVFAIPFMLIVSILRMRRNRVLGKEWMILLGLVVIVEAPLLFYPWALPYFYYDFTHPETKAQTIRMLGETHYSIPQMMYLTAAAMTWGDTMVRGAFAIIMSALAILCTLVLWKRDRGLLLVAAILLVSNMLYYIGQGLSGNPFSTRHQSFLMPIVILFIACGIWNLPFLFSRGSGAPNKYLQGIAGVLLFAALLLFIDPAWASARLLGKPVPYKEFVRWCDSNLPKGTLVLVDRWLEPWNELRVHNSTNVYFTFTVPNEPLDVFIHANWRETAKEFFRKYPDAAYLEIAKEFWENPTIGPWNWPRTNFNHHVVFRNEEALRLRELGLIYRDTGGPYTNRLIVELFYNTRDEVVDKARMAGQKTLMFYGPEWEYVKTQQDYRDWRVLTDQATLDVYNLTDQPISANMSLIAVAASGPKHIGIAGYSLDFEPNRVDSKTVGPVVLRPGKNELMMQDRLWPSIQTPLLVGDVKVEETGAPPL